MKGLICAGGSATRLAELTRVTNKHLLPVGRWPMVYYPLQLLQQVGVHEVLLGAGVWIVEELRFPAQVFDLPQPVTFWSLPVNFKGFSGAFCRPVIAVD